jgi:hypothetical protein
MKLTTASVLAISAIVLGGCARQPTPYATYGYPTPAKPAALTHRYDVVVRGAAGTPIQGAKVNFTPLDRLAERASTKECVTDNSGRCEYAVEVQRAPTLTYVDSYRSRIEYKVEKDGYFTKTGKAANIYDGKIGQPEIDTLVSLYVPEDYMAAGFGKTPAERELRDKATKFLSLIQLQSLLNEAEVPLHAIGVSEFKGRKYFQLKLKSTTEYNTLKLDKYAVGKRLFDDSLRKVLNPLNEFISNPKSFYGYDLIIDGYSKNFGEKYATPSKTEYRFLMPQDAVRKYKDKDLSGQQLLDASVILMDDERIDMKLQ